MMSMTQVCFDPSAFGLLSPQLLLMGTLQLRGMLGYLKWKRLQQHE